MSETVHYKGILTIVERLENESLEGQCKRLLDNAELLDYYDSYQEMIANDYYEKYFVYNNVLYSIDKKDIDPDDDLFVASKINDKNIKFEVRYYNGGCCLEEALEVALERMNRTI